MRTSRVSRLRASLAAVLLLACGAAPASDGAQQAGPPNDRRPDLATRAGVMVVAHRACWQAAPENSIRAIEECVRLGVDMVEIDVRTTRDGHLVAMHDATVDRTTDGNGPLAGLALRELLELRLRERDGGVGAPLTDERVPTLEQVLAAARNRILVNLDAKSDTRDDAYRLAASMGVTDHILIKMPLRSLENEELRKAAFFGDAHFMPIVREDWGGLAARVARLAAVDPVAFEIIYRTEGQLGEACSRAATQGARCWVNTMWDRLSPGHSDAVSVTDPDRHWGHLVRLGVDMIQTDRPEELLRYLEHAGHRP